jgi:hypothetical protein
MEAPRLGVFEVTSDGISFSSLNYGQSLDRKFLISVRCSACYITEKKGLRELQVVSPCRDDSIYSLVSVVLKYLVALAVNDVDQRGRFQWRRILCRTQHKHAGLSLTPSVHLNFSKGQIFVPCLNVTFEMHRPQDL